MYTSEIYPGRVQEFRYVTDAEADQLRKEREQMRAESAPKPAANPAAAAEVKPPQAQTPPEVPPK